MRFLSTFIRRWYLYVLPVLLLPSVMFAYGTQRLSRYESTSYLFINEPSFLQGVSTGSYNSYDTPAQNAASAITELLGSNTFAAKVGEGTALATRYDTSTALGTDSLAYFVRAEISVTPSTTGPNALVIAAWDKSAHISQQLVTSLISQFIVSDNGRQLKIDTDAEAFYNQQLSNAKAQLNKDGKTISTYETNHPTSSTTGSAIDPQLTQLQAQYTQDSDAVTKLQATIGQIDLQKAAVLSGDSQSITVLDTASLPLAPIVNSKKLYTYVGLAALGGLVIAALMVGLVTLFNRKVHSKEDLRVILDDLDMPIALIESVSTMPSPRHKQARECMAISSILLPAPGESIGAEIVPQLSEPVPAPSTGEFE